MSIRSGVTKMSGSLALGSEEAWWTVCKVSRHHIYLFIYLFIYIRPVVHRKSEKQHRKYYRIKTLKIKKHMWTHTP